MQANKSVTTSEFVDWKIQIKSNNRKTAVVIFLFVFIYLFIGFLVDCYLHPELREFGLLQKFIIFSQFQVFPLATIAVTIVAIIAIFITFAFYDRIMLMGTEYKAISAESYSNQKEKQLCNVVEELTIAAGIRYIPKIYIINAEHMNAFASGYSEKSALIAITEGLLEKLSRNALQAVVAHELSHIRHNDIKLTLTASVLSNIMLIILDFLFYNIIFGGGDRRRRSDSNLSGLIIILRYILPITTAILMLYLSRTREFAADAGSVELVRNNSSLGEALIKISNDHKQNAERYSYAYGASGHEDMRRSSYVFDPTQAGISVKSSVLSLFSTHPPLNDRLRALGLNPEPEEGENA